MKLREHVAVNLSFFIFTSKLLVLIELKDTSPIFAGDKTSRDLCPEGDRKACMDFLAGQKGHSSQKIMNALQSQFGHRPLPVLLRRIIL